QQAGQIRERGDGDGFGAAPGVEKNRPDRQRAVHALTRRRTSINMRVRFFSGSSFFRSSFDLFFWIALFAARALAQEPGAGAAQTVRPEVGKPIQAAIELIKSKKGKEALAKVREAQAVGDRTPYENYLVERVLGQAAATAGDASTAARAFENVATSPASPEGERRQFFAAAASQYYLMKNYAKTAELAARYFRDGGTEKSMRTIYVQALYLGNDFASAAKE